ncbi:choice-of-anchor M domain-containing protein [Streptomyces sp. MMCC 100]|uniref:choice-of-anchor M domain-containing protein n=1 Tax=Streptomyces sp. MMCC 100 TaxID=3163555 RepID=UPI003594DD5F
MGSLARSACVVGALSLTLSGLLSASAEADGVSRAVGGAYEADAGTVAEDVHDERIVIDQGHVDAVAPRMVDGTFRTLFRDSRTSDIVWREPESVIMHLTSEGREVVPEPAGGAAFIGEAGHVYYLIPQVQDSALLWAGWSTEAFSSSSVQGKLSFSLDQVEGPGGVLVFGWSPFGEPLMRFDSRDGLPDTYGVPAVTHEHANWVFTEPGVYRLTFTVAATLASGEQVKDSQTYTMAVGDIDPDDVPLPGDPGGDTGGSTGGDTGGSSGGDTGGDSGDDTGGSSGGDTGGDSGGNTGGGTGGSSGGDTGGDAGGGSNGSTGGDSGQVTGGGAGGDSGDDTAGPSGGDSGSGTGGTSGGADVPDGSGGRTGTGLVANGGEGSADSKELAHTGAEIAVPLGAGGAALLLAGAGAVYIGRRRTHATATDHH